MAARTLIRPTAFIDSPFGFDGKVARLAGGLNWFAAVELLVVEGNRRVASELVSVEALEPRLDEDLAAQWAALTAPRPPLTFGERTVRLDQPQVMAILNVTPDSFSDGGSFEDPSTATEAGVGMASEGAAIVDVGGKSTRPGAKAVWAQDEIERVVPVVQRLASSGAAVSIDTRKSEVMTAAIGAGARLVNDVSALTFDPRSAETVAGAGSASSSCITSGRLRRCSRTRATTMCWWRFISGSKSASPPPRQPASIATAS